MGLELNSGFTCRRLEEGFESKTNKTTHSGPIHGFNACHQPVWNPVHLRANWILTPEYFRQKWSEERLLCSRQPAREIRFINVKTLLKVLIREGDHEEIVKGSERLRPTRCSSKLPWEHRSCCTCERTEKKVDAAFASYLAHTKKENYLDLTFLDLVSRMSRSHSRVLQVRDPYK